MIIGFIFKWSRFGIREIYTRFAGDSGGPLMIPVYENGTFPFYQIGIVSGSEGCAEPGILDIYANVQYYADWIHENLKTIKIA